MCFDLQLKELSSKPATLKILDQAKAASGQRFPLKDLLNVPMQRILKYPLLLKARPFFIRSFSYFTQELIKHTPVKDRSIYENTRWAEIDPNGAILPASIMDMQNFFAKRGEVKQVVPIDRIVDLDPVKKALEKLGAAGK